MIYYTVVKRWKGHYSYMIYVNGKCDYGAEGVYITLTVDVEAKVEAEEVVAYLIKDQEENRGTIRDC